jgi:hypothetical protein
VLDGVRGVRTDSFMNLLKVVFRWSGAPLEIVVGCRHEHLVGVLDLLPDVVVVRHHGETMRKALFPLLSTLSARFGASDGDIGGAVQPPSVATPASAKVKAACNSLIFAKI